jgi:hypothetical protein
MELFFCCTLQTRRKKKQLQLAFILSDKVLVLSGATQNTIRVAQVVKTTNPLPKCTCMLQLCS